MPQLTKPYHRIWRPLSGFISEIDTIMGDLVDENVHPSIEYLSDDRFACQSEMKFHVNAAHLIIRDLYEIFNFVEPDDRNLGTFSHRLYELFFRICTEFESNCKGILFANSYPKTHALNIKDYFKLESVCKLSAYKVTFDKWNNDHVFIPFQAWKNTSSYVALPWYQDYNNVKHNRFQEFDKAKLSNVMDALSGLICILHAQIGSGMSNVTFSGFGNMQVSQLEVKGDTFTLMAPPFNEDEYYNFIWDNLKNESNPVNNYQF